MTNDKLPEETQEQVCNESAQYLKKLIADKRDPCCYAVTDYIAGATAWAPWKVKYDDLRDQARRMADALQRIIDNGEHEDYGSTNESCAVCIATQALQQFKDGKEVGNG